MAQKKSGLSYVPADSVLHRMTGGAKLVFLLLVSLAAMITFDTRLLVALSVLVIVLFFISKMPLADMKMVLVIMLGIMVLNLIITYLFSPEEGVAIYGSRTELLHIIGRYSVTSEQLFYLLNMTLKYFVILPMALIFFVTTEPSEFASSLNTIGVNYKVAYSVSLALRYLPTVQREYQDVSKAQAARGVDTSKNAKLPARLRGIVSQLFPLIITSIDRIERISAAMELRSFGRNPKRTWYRGRPFTALDFITIAFAVLTLVAAIVLFVVNGSRFWNPFS